MLKKFNSIINYTIVLAILFLLVGLTLILFPDLSIITISYILSISLIILGIVLVLYSIDKILFTSFLSLGVLQILLGVIILIYPNVLTTVIPITVGVWMILKAVSDFSFSMILRKIKNKDWFYVAILSVLAIVCGIMLMTNTEIGTITLTVVVGIFLSAYSLSAIINAAIFRENVNDIAKELGLHKNNKS